MARRPLVIFGRSDHNLARPPPQLSTRLLVALDNCANRFFRFADEALGRLGQFLQVKVVRIAVLAPEMNGCNRTKVRNPSRDVLLPADVEQTSQHHTQFVSDIGQNVHDVHPK